MNKPGLYILKNNLSKEKSTIPNIDIQEFGEWKNSIYIECSSDFSFVDFFITIKSYADSLVLVPYQFLSAIYRENAKKYVFTDSIAIYKLKKMDLVDFSA